MHMALLWIVPFISFFIGYGASYLFIQKKSINAPQLVGKSLQDAFSLTKQHHLTMQLLEEQEDAGLTEGTVIHQMPHAGQSMHINQPLAITLSKIPTLTKTPHCLHKTYEEITTDTKKKLLSIKSIWLNSSYPQNKCFAQFPQIGIPMKKAQIKVFCSRGPAQLFLVPDVIGQTIENAHAYFNSTGIQVTIVGQNHDDSSSSKNLCTIIDQSPMSGSIVDLSKKFCIHLYIKEI